MEKAVSAADAKRRFSELLRIVKKGRSVIVTSHGKPVAKIMPIVEDERAAEGARSAYAQGTNVGVMRDKTLELIHRLPPSAVVLPVPTLGELFNLLVRKAKRRPVRARAAVLNWRDAYAVVETSD